jgi:hypothetical protein
MRRKKMNNQLYMVPNTNHMPYEQSLNYSPTDSRVWGGFGWGRPFGFGFGFGRPFFGPPFGFGVPFGFGFGYPFFGGFPFFI